MADRSLPGSGVSRRLFIVLFSVVAAAVLALAAVQVADGVGSHAGPIGPAGSQGATGPQGSPGAAAATPTPLVTGIPGATGATGPRGPAGRAAPTPTPVDGGTYHLVTADFVHSLIQIPTSNLLVDTTTLGSRYFAGSIPVLDANNAQVGTFSASFVSLQTPNGITTTIDNHFVTDSGLIADWSTLAPLINLETDTIVDALATESTVTDATKSGTSPFFGHRFDLVVSAGSTEISFRFNPFS